MSVSLHYRPRSGLQPGKGLAAGWSAEAPFNKAGETLSMAELRRPDDVELRLAANPGLRDGGSATNHARVEHAKAQVGRTPRSAPQGAQRRDDRRFQSRENRPRDLSRTEILRLRDETDVRIRRLPPGELLALVRELAANPRLMADESERASVVGALNYVGRTPEWPDNPHAVANIGFIARNAQLFCSHGLKSWQIPD